MRNKDVTVRRKGGEVGDGGGGQEGREREEDEYKVGGGGGGGALPNGGCLLGVNGARENPERLSHLTYRETAF